MDAGSAVAVAREERTELPHGERGLPAVVAERQRLLRRVLHHLVMNSVRQLVVARVLDEVGVGVAELAAFQGDDRDAGLQQLVRDDPAGPAEADHDRIDRFERRHYDSPPPRPIFRSTSAIPTGSATRYGTLYRPMKALYATGVPDQLPADLVPVPAVHRIGKEALIRVRIEHLEEQLSRDALERQLPLLERLPDRVLQRRRELVEPLPVSFLAVRVRLGDRQPIDLARRQRQLIALCREPLGPRALPVHLGGEAELAAQLLVDEVCDAGFFGAGSELVRGDQALDRRFDERRFGRREKRVGFGAVLERFERRRLGRRFGGSLLRCALGFGDRRDHLGGGNAADQRDEISARYMLGHGQTSATPML